MRNQETGDVQPFSSEFVDRYRLKSPSNAQRAAEVLMERDLIDRDDGSFVVLDRFFQRWIVRQQGWQQRTGFDVRSFNARRGETKSGRV